MLRHAVLPRICGTQASVLFLCLWPGIMYTVVRLSQPQISTNPQRISINKRRAAYLLHFVQRDKQPNRTCRCLPPGGGSRWANFVFLAHSPGTYMVKDTKPRLPALPPGRLARAGRPGGAVGTYAGNEQAQGALKAHWHPFALVLHEVLLSLPGIFCGLLLPLVVRA